jgi:hypothetical protein
MRKYWVPPAATSMLDRKISIMAKPIPVGIIGVGLEPRKAKVSHLPSVRALAGVALVRGRGVLARDRAAPRGTLTALEHSARVLSAALATEEWRALTQAADGAIA